MSNGNGPDYGKEWQVKDRPPAPTPTKPMQDQIGGTHYKDMVIQPLEYSMANNLNACEHSVVKYVSRHKSKNGREDLEKAIDMLNKLIEFEYDTPKT